MINIKKHIERAQYILFFFMIACVLSLENAVSDAEHINLYLSVGALLAAIVALELLEAILRFARVGRRALKKVNKKGRYGGKKIYLQQ